MARRIGVIFGGRSGEHDVSLMSAESVMAALQSVGYDVIPIGISRDGRWWTGARCLDALRAGRPEEAQPAMFLPDPSRPSLHGEKAGGGWEPIPVDVFFPLVHGPFGEDGTLQGLLEMAGRAYVGAGVAASALGMDKSLMKAAFQAAGLPQVEYRVVSSARWRSQPAAVKEEIVQSLGFPCFVKPASLGSSVGISRVVDEARLGAAMDEAAALSQKVVVERGLAGFREVEVGVLGNDDPEVSVPGEVVPAADYYDYRAKYEDDRTQLIVPASVRPETAERLKAMGRAAFQAIDGSGLARVDFFVSPDETVIFLNEINTMPGFTRMSMYPRVWQSSGLSYGQLLQRLIALAEERHAAKEQVSAAQAAWRPPRES